ncbi:hypothetical protein C7H81_21540 [Bacillus subtilis]|nr:hypothetical protein C7H81_21540 [Bacillus subtilis]
MGREKAIGHSNLNFGETAITFWLCIKELDYMLGNGESDRQVGLSKKTPEYAEAKGKETKLEE